MKSYDIAIIGAGVSGSSIARALSRYKCSICVVDKNTDVCEGTSKANSAIVHAGYDPEPGSLKAQLNVLGNRMMDSIASELDIPFKRIGALVLCLDSRDYGKLEELYLRGKENGVPGLELLRREEVLKKEPHISDLVHSALYVPTSGVICPFELTMGFAENAAENGADFLLGTTVKTVAKTPDGYNLITDKGEISAKVLINAAGVYADEIHNQLCPESPIKITPRAGEYLLLDRSAGNYVSNTIFQLPGIMGKGILVSPTVHGNLLLGPTSADTSDKEATRTTVSGLSHVESTAALSIENLPISQVITSFTGLRAHMGEDFFIRESLPGFFEAAAIESPGLTAAPAIGEKLASMAAAYLKLSENPNFSPYRKRVQTISDMSPQERAAAIEENPAYGAIVCRCEEISEGEILDAIRRPLGAVSLDGIKRRTRAGMGRCQSGFCSPRVMELLSEELGIPMTEICKNQPGSKIIGG